MRAMATSEPKRNSIMANSQFSFAWVIRPAFAFALVFASSCGGSLFKVKPAATLPPMPATVASANLGSVSFRAAPLLTDEESQELFESNLQLAGILPVRIEINHLSGDAIELKKVRFRLTDAAGTKWKVIFSQRGHRSDSESERRIRLQPVLSQNIRAGISRLRTGFENPADSQRRPATGLHYFSRTRESAGVFAARFGIDDRRPGPTGSSKS